MGIGIRDIILMAIVGVSLPLSVMQPFFGLLVFSWFAYMRPNDMTWGINELRPSLWIAVATILGVILHKKERFLVLEKRTVLLGMFLAAVAVSVAVAPDPKFAFEQGNLVDLAKILFVALLTTGLVSTRDRLRLLLLVVAGSLGVLALKGVFDGIRTGGAIIHGPGGAILDNNDFGLALVMCVPLLAYLARDEKGPFLRALLAAMAAACVLGVLLTRSRGGVVALGVLAIVWLFKLRKNGWALMFAPAAVALVIVFAPSELWDRVRALTTDGAANDPSAQGRIIAWQKAISMWQANPVFGVGPGYFNTPEVWSAYPPETAIKPVVAHNTYLQILAESGTITLVIFLAMLLVTLWSLGRTQTREDQPWRERYASGIFLSLIGFMAGSFFLSRTHFDLTYHLVGISVALRVATEGGEFDWSFGMRRRFFGGTRDGGNDVGPAGV